MELKFGKEIECRGFSLAEARHWTLHRGLLLCIPGRWSIPRLPLCIIQISYANSVINNAGTERFIIPRYQRRLNTADLHANSPNDAAAIASEWTISSCRIIPLQTHSAIFRHEILYIRQIPQKLTRIETKITAIRFLNLVPILSFDF